MYKNQFDREFQSNIIYSSYMFYGESEYLVDFYTNMVALKIAKGNPIYKVYFDEYDYKECLNYLSQSSLFSQTNILLIKTLKKIPKIELEKLIALCMNNPDNFLLFSCTGDTNFKTMAKSFTSKTKSCEVRFFHPKDAEALQILKSIIHQKHIVCGDKELYYLYTIHQKDLSLVVNDLEKLSLLQTPLTSNIISTHCFGLGTVTIDSFLEKLFTAKIINNDLYMILEEGMNEIQLVIQTNNFLQQLFMIHSYLAVHQTLDIKAIWGYDLPKDIAHTRATIASKFSQKDFREMFNFFAHLELDLKTKTHLERNSYTQAQFRKFSASLR